MGLARGKIKTFSLVVTMAISLFIAAVPMIASAADFNLTASPLPVDLSVKPGGTVTTPLKIENTGTQTVRVKLNLLKFKANGNTGKPEIVTPDASDASVKWVSFSQNTFDAEPNVWHTVTMTIKTPKDAAFGYYYAVIFSQDNGKPLVTPGQHSVVTGAIATLVLLDVNAPGEKRSLSVTGFRSVKKIYEFLPARFNITVHNSGNVHAVPFGDIFVGRGKNNNLATLQINASAGNILPGTDRVFSVDWNDGFPSYQPKKANGQVLSDKSGKPIQSLSWNGMNLGKLRFGSYHAHLVLTYNDGTRDIPIEGDVSFWVIPWRLLLAVILIPTIPALLVYLLMKRRMKKKYGGQKA